MHLKFAGDYLKVLPFVDITNAASFTGIQKWVDKVKQEADPNCAMLIVGNKCV